tara:strand:+ start:290 stop:628 length:339 start_codon:yes stop_codon:yes gene_type:complete
MNEKNNPTTTLFDLYETISARRNADPQNSYSAKLLSLGTEKIAEKLGEEAIETVIAAIKKDPVELQKESADLIYHLLVLLVDANVNLENIIEELEQRKGISGIMEKTSRTEF